MNIQYVKNLIILTGICLSCLSLNARPTDEDGSRLWLRMPHGSHAVNILYNGKTDATVDIAIRELKNYWNGKTVRLQRVSYPKIKEDGFLIKDNGNELLILSSTSSGLMYGSYTLLRMQETGQSTSKIEIKEEPAYSLRILNHWDNLDGTVERGYAGHSLWKWNELPGKLSHRYREYARANASIGINATVLNNVNASSQILSQDYLQKIKALADVFRPYGIRVFLSVNFASPIQLGGLKTADPINKEVQTWWSEKVKSIYKLIPDFGGFLVKANSEGQPGPCDYNRSHAEGANMLAKALRPYKGIVIWRAFVYAPHAGLENDRAKQAAMEFQPLDGRFNKNVLLQIKNGPVDFQPREPYSPLFTSLKHTPMIAEFQITQEYLGESNHMIYLAPMWKEFFENVNPESLQAIAGVSNIGDATDWCGHPFAQANWYAFGRLAWNPALPADKIAEEWLAQTFSKDTAFINPVKTMMAASRESAVDYMMPLGLHHIFAWGHHYGPEPWCKVEGARLDWLPSYYHKADSTGIGFDRSATGSNAVSQYPDAVRKEYGDIRTCPEQYLLWFHHVPWTFRLKSGKTLWDELCYHYDRGVHAVRKFQQIWDRTRPYVDNERFSNVQYKLKIQARDAVWWKDACLLYFQTFSKLPIPYELERPVHDLKEMQDFKLNITNYECAPYGFDR